MDSKRRAFFNRIFGKNFWDFRKNQYYFYYLDGIKLLDSLDKPIKYIE